MTQEPQSLEALQKELAELESQLQSIHTARAEHEQAQLAALEQEREEYNRDYQEKMKRQEMIIRRAQLDPFWFVDGGYLGTDGGDY